MVVTVLRINEQRIRGDIAVRAGIVGTTTPVRRAERTPDIIRAQYWRRPTIYRVLMSKCHDDVVEELRLATEDVRQDRRTSGLSCHYGVVDDQRPMIPTRNVPKDSRTTAPSIPDDEVIRNEGIRSTVDVDTTTLAPRGEAPAAVQSNR